MKKYSLLLFYLPLCFTAFGQFNEIQKIDSMFVKWENNQSPGAALGIIKDGELIYSRGYGIANLDYGIPITNESKFYIASTSKQFTAASIALLSIAGNIKLDDNIRVYLPEMPDYANEITIRHLIHHTSGLRDYLALMYLSGDSFEDYFSISDGINKLKKQKALNFSPGEKFQYSNTGYLLLAEIVNRTSGMTIKQYVEKQIFQPLGMKHTFFNDDCKQVIENRVTSYSVQEEGTYKRFIINFDALGDGNLWTTVHDLYLWDQNFYTKAVGGQELQDILLSRGVLNSGDTLQYAFGHFHDQYHGLKTISHSGAMLGFNAEYIRFPEQHFSVIVLVNRSDVNASLEAFQIADVFLKNKFVSQPENKEEIDIVKPNTTNSEATKYLSKLNLRDYIGSFYCEELEISYLINLEEEKLRLQIADYPPLEMSINDVDSFTSDLGSIHFIRSNKAIIGFKFNVIGGTNLKFEKK